MVVVPNTLQQFERLVRDGSLLSIHDYDKIIVSFSGGKDSLSMVLQMLDWAVDQQEYPRCQIELWHQDVDGGTALMDWPCTPSYCRAVARALRLPLRFQWKDEGFHGELLRDDGPTKGVYYEDGRREVQYLPPGRGKHSTRRKFPAKSANLQVRWCSPYLKIDVAKRALNNDPRFGRGKYLFLTGERRQESTARSKYNEVEKHGTTNKKRRTDQWRSVIDWDERFVWEAIERHGIVPHPAYRLGWGRVSCMACIFGDKNQWASVRHIAPDRFEQIHQFEREFDHTIDNRLSVVEMANRGKSFVDADQSLVDLALGTDYPEEMVFTSQWEVPAGAYKSCGGPT